MHLRISVDSRNIFQMSRGNCDHNICFKSCASSGRFAKDYDVAISETPKKSKVLQDGEPHQSLCTDVCGPGFSEKSCGKTVFICVYPISTPEKSCLVYALLATRATGLWPDHSFSILRVFQNIILCSTPCRPVQDG